VTAGKSHPGKPAFFALLVGVIVLAALVAHFLSRIDKSLRDLPQMAMETIQEKMTELGNPAPPVVQKDRAPDRDATRPASTSSDGKPESTARAKAPCPGIFSGSP